MILSRLQGVLGVRPGEGPTAFRVLAMMLVAMAGAAVGANGVESLFFSLFGPEFLPYLYVVLGPLTLAVMVGMGTAVSGQSTRFLVRLPLVLAATLLLARAVLVLGLEGSYPVLWLVMMVLWTAQVMWSWAVAGSVSDTRQAKRLFPLYGAGVVVGGVLGGLATGPLARLLHAENLLLVWVGALLVASLLAGSIQGTRARGRRPRRRQGMGVVRQSADGFRDLWRWPLLRWMSVSLALFGVLYFTLSLLFAEAATARFPRTDDLAGFLGLFMSVTNGAALLVSLLLANRLFARFGVLTMVLGLAVVYLVGFGVLTLGASSFAALLGFRFVQMVWVNGVWITGWQALFNVVPPERRARTRTLMDGGPLQLGVVAAGALLILADRVLVASHLYVVGAGAAGLAVWSMWRARRAYGRALTEALRIGNPDVFRPDEEPFGGFRGDADVHASVVAGTADPDPAVRMVSVEVLADTAPDTVVRDLVPALVRVLGDADPKIRGAAVRGLARAGDPTGLEATRVLLHDPDPWVRARTAGALPDDPEAAAVLEEMWRDPRPEFRVAAIGVLGRTGRDHGQALAALADPAPSVRRAAAEALAASHSARSVEPLVAALADPDPAVEAAAAAALARIGPPARDALLRALSSHDLEAGALVALSSIPGTLPAPLRTYARERVELAGRYHRLWLAVRAEPDDRMDLLAHAVRHRTVALALNALRAVTQQGDPAAMARAIDNLTSRDQPQRANALETLEAVGEREVVRPLLAVWDGSPVRSTARSTVRDDAITELLHDPDSWLRACAALAAGSQLDGDLTPLLEELARSDPEPLVREAATVTLRGGTVETLTTLSLLERVVFLRKVPIFEQLSPADLKHIAEVASEHAFPDGEVIAEQGEAGDELHIVVSGAIRVVAGRDGASHEVARRLPGECVGEMAIVSEESRMASLVCSGPVRTLSLDGRRFQRILRERPDASLRVMRVLCDRLREADVGAPAEQRPPDDRR
jgi:CRP/FNR family cyclic AMP-dependent transcriptional regulator